MRDTPEPPPGPTVAVLTVSYGSGAELAGFLASVPAASSSVTFVVVVDNKSADDSVEDLARSAGAHYLPLENLGYGRGMNAGAATVPDSVRWLLVSNPDVRLSPGSIDYLVAAGEETSAIGSVGPAIKTDGEIYPSARAVPALRTGVGHALFANFWLSNPWTRAYRRSVETAPVRRDAGWLSGACVLVRRSAFDDLRGFDPGYFMYFEDVDLGYRLGLAGFRNVYEPSAEVEHSGAHSTTEDSAKMISAHHDSALRFLNKKYSGRAFVPLRWALSLGLRLRGSALIRKIPPT